jgi:hypothetical protein
MWLCSITVIAFYKFVPVSLFGAIKRVNFKKQDMPRGDKNIASGDGGAPEGKRNYFYLLLSTRVILKMVVS